MRLALVPSRRWPSLVLGLALMVAVSWTLWWRFKPEPEPTFCTTDGELMEVDGEIAFLQDGGEPGRDGCDGGDHDRRNMVLGFDCKVRNSRGDVTATTTPNRPDGTCGQQDEK